MSDQNGIHFSLMRWTFQFFQLLQLQSTHSKHHMIFFEYSSHLFITFIFLHHDFFSLSHQSIQLLSGQMWFLLVFLVFSAFFQKDFLIHDHFLKFYFSFIHSLYKCSLYLAYKRINRNFSFSVKMSLKDNKISFIFK